MATNRIEASKFTGEEEEASGEASAQSGKAVAAERGGFKAWLPLLANVVLMPVVAYVMTTMVLLPKMNPHGQAAKETGKDGGHGGAGAGRNPTSGKSEYTVALNGKVLVNVAGTMGARYLLANITFVGANPDLKSLVEKNDAQLRDVAASVLAGKTIADLDKPGSRNLIRTELVSAFNNVLGNGTVTGIFFTEFAIQ